MRYDGDPETCLASTDPGVTTRVTSGSAIEEPYLGEEGTYDIGQSMRLLMDMLFVIDATGIALAIIWLILGGILGALLYPITNLLGALCRFGAAIVGLYALILRFTHPGQVCAGAFLDADDSTEGYMTSIGLFWLVCGYIFVITWGYVCLAIMCAPRDGSY